MVLIVEFAVIIIVLGALDCFRDNQGFGPELVCNSVD